eukprot:gene39668-53631_t
MPRVRGRSTRPPQLCVYRIFRTSVNGRLAPRSRDPDDWGWRENDNEALGDGSGNCARGIGLFEPADGERQQRGNDSHHRDRQYRRGDAESDTDACRQRNGRHRAGKRRRAQRPFQHGVQYHHAGLIAWQ